MSKKFYNIFILLLSFTTVFISGCGNSKDKTANAEIEEAAKFGRTHALEVISQESEQKREEGILEIRAREQKLRKEGLDKCADAYSKAADDVFSSELSDE